MNRDTKEFFSTTTIIGIGFLILVTLFGAYHFLSKPAQVLDKITNPDNIVGSYEEFQSTYNTCLDLCTKIKNLESSNVEAQGFSKEERVLALKNNLSRWVQEYNAKSKMITKNMWKSSALPYQLDVNTICN